MERRRLIGMAAGLVLGAGAALGVAACGGEDRGSVEVDTGGGTGTSGAGTAGTTGTAPRTTGTAPLTTGTAPETTGTEAGTNTSP